MNDGKISAGTIARTIILALALINQILSQSGHSVIPISDETINAVVSNSFTVIAALAAWWKNNSFTKAAIAGDVAKELYKANEKETSN